jgi:hypothetical protein
MNTTGSWCNPGDSFCDGTLPIGSGNSGQFSYHSVQLRDDSEAYTHYVAAGIPNPLFSDMSAYAK